MTLTAKEIEEALQEGHDWLREHDDYHRAAILRRLIDSGFVEAAMLYYKSFVDLEVGSTAAIKRDNFFRAGRRLEGSE